MGVAGGSHTIRQTGFAIGTGSMVRFISSFPAPSSAFMASGPFSPEEVTK
jgi:hypothetical protein